MEYKNTDAPQGTNEPEVFASVMNELKTIGENTNKAYDELRKAYKALENTMKGDISGQGEKIERLKEDIVTRQDELDKKLQLQEVQSKRLDDLEIALKRPSFVNSVSNADFEREAKNFFVSASVVQKKRMSFEDLSNFVPDIEKYSAYKKAMDSYYRRGDERATDIERKALSVGIDPDGGYTVSPTLSSRILDKMYETDPLRQLASVQSISTDSLEIGVDWSQFDFGWEGETETGSETNTATFGKKVIPVHQMYAKPKATQQLLEDSSINIEAWIANKVADRFSRGEAAAFVTGDGIGKPRGFLTYTSETPTDGGGVSVNRVEQVAMGNATNLTADGFINIKYALQEFFLNRGTWLMNRTTLRDAMLLKDGMGNYLWKPSFGVDSPSTILSLPVRMSTTMPAVAANALAVALADWQEAYQIVDRLGITVQRDPYTKKPFVEFYTRKRVGGDVVNWDAIKLGIISV